MLVPTGLNRRFKYPERIEIATAAARERLAFEDRPLYRMAPRTVDARYVIDLTTSTWRWTYDRHGNSISQSTNLHTAGEAWPYKKRIGLN
jgi:hypothetical protein